MIDGWLYPRGPNRQTLGPNNTDTKPPTYCPPFPEAQIARLAGQTVASMGPLEPAICGHGYYCPKGGKERLICPAGHYCPQGSFEATECTFGSICSEGSYFTRSYLPLAFLGFLDIIIVTTVVAVELMGRKRKSCQSRDGGIQRLKKAFTFSTANFESPKFHSLPHDDVQLESKIVDVRRSPTGFLSEVDNFCTYEGDEDSISYKAERSDPDIQQLVKSLSRCTLASSFGLSFDFENLRFQPNQKNSAVLSDVSGQIHSGTLSGVMGASGAGKSTFVNVLMGQLKSIGLLLLLLYSCSEVEMRALYV